MKRGARSSAAGWVVISWLGLAACHPAAAPSQTAANVAHAEPTVLGLGKKPDRRFVYVVEPDGVYVTPRPVDADGRPVFVRKAVKVASIVPALDPGDRRVVDRDGDLVPAPGKGGASPKATAHRLVVLVADPARIALESAPRSREEFLALDDHTLVEYASAWLRYRDGAAGSEPSALSGTERDVLLASLAFSVVEGDGFSGLLALRGDDLPAMGESLRRMALVPFAEVVDRAVALALSGKQAESGTLDALWKQVRETETQAEHDPVHVLAAYIRAHADEIDWERMRR
jgi:hypothetical protein